MKKLFASKILVLFTAVASLSICLACIWIMYQPELPQKPQSIVI